jgi:hypothetical protein
MAELGDHLETLAKQPGEASVVMLTGAPVQRLQRKEGNPIRLVLVP